MNTFGRLLRITTFGESHGNSVGVVVDGVPPNLDIDIEKLKLDLSKRSPGKDFTSKRIELDLPEIVSGIFENKTIGSPICVIVKNTNQKSKDYEDLKDLFRPSHADYTYQKKYGIRDYRGGGRASARETLSRVIGGYFARVILNNFVKDLVVKVAVTQIASVKSTIVENMDYDEIYKSTFRCNDIKAELLYEKLLDKLISDGDSAGGIVSAHIVNLPIGIGEPIYDKLNSRLSQAMMSINGAMGFEIGAGFEVANKFGSENNDDFIISDGKISTSKNNSGGIQGGISNGNYVNFNVAFKPPSSISKLQYLATSESEIVRHKIIGRHDPTIVIRAVPVVEAMTLLVLADLVLINNLYKNTNWYFIFKIYKFDFLILVFQISYLKFSFNLNDCFFTSCFLKN